MKSDKTLCSLFTIITSIDLGLCIQMYESEIRALQIAN